MVAGRAVAAVSLLLESILLILSLNEIAALLD
jgi:hypothetical protein